jgi:hypothetical protein
MGCEVECKREISWNGPNQYQRSNPQQIKSFPSFSERGDEWEQIRFHMARFREVRHVGEKSTGRFARCGNGALFDLRLPV